MRLGLRTCTKGQRQHADKQGKQAKVGSAHKIREAPRNRAILITQRLLFTSAFLLLPRVKSLPLRYFARVAVGFEGSLLYGETWCTNSTPKIPANVGSIQSTTRRHRRG